MPRVRRSVTPWVKHIASVKQHGRGTDLSVLSDRVSVDMSSMPWFIRGYINSIGGTGGVFARRYKAVPLQAGIYSGNGIRMTAAKVPIRSSCTRPNSDEGIGFSRREERCCHRVVREVKPK